VFTSADGVQWRPIASLGGQPVAFTALSARELFVATSDRTIRGSRDGGLTWQVLAAY
jgi:hypothetical protein